MHIFEKPINVGVTSHSKAKYAGFIWVKDENGSPKTIAFTVDRPELISRGVNFFTLRRMLKQFHKMELRPHMIEVITEQRTYCYNTSPYKLVADVAN